MGCFNSLTAKQFLTCCISIKKGDERDGRNQQRQVSSSIHNARFTILDFPTCILVEILARLPIKSILICRCVCKTFSGLLSDPYFHNAFRIKQPFAMMFVSGKAKGPLYLLEVGDPQKLTRLQVRKNMPKPEGAVRFVGSCNGLICVSVYYSIRDSLIQEMIHICNPVLGEYVTLPRIRESFFAEWFGFGLNPCTNQYKVVRIAHHSLPNEGYVRPSTEVFTIGVDVKWRTLKHANCEYFLEYHRSGPLFEGAIHWLPEFQGKIHWLHEPYRLGRRYEFIIAFDLDEEKFRSISTPEDMISKIRACNDGRSTICKLLVMRNCLSIFCFTKPDEFNIWTMRKYEIVESWSKSYSIRDSLLSGYYEDWYNFVVLPTPANVWGDGDIFIFSSKTGLISYNLEGKKSTEVNCDDMKNMYVLSGDTYIPSLISLKNLFPVGQVKQNREWFSTT